MEVVKLLLESGADLNAKNIENKSPLDVARERGQTEAARIIEEFIASRLAILGVEAPELHAGEWGKMIVRARGLGEAKISIEGDVEFEAPKSLELRGEKNVELLVKPSASGQVPVKISLESLGIKVTRMFTLQVKSRVELVVKFLVGRRVELGQLEGDLREKLRPLLKRALIYFSRLRACRSSQTSTLRRPWQLFQRRSLAILLAMRRRSSCGRRRRPQRRLTLGRWGLCSTRPLRGSRFCRWTT
jgi:hypothetical protein